MKITPHTYERTQCVLLVVRQAGWRARSLRPQTDSSALEANHMVMPDGLAPGRTGQRGEEE